MQKKKISLRLLLTVLTIFAIAVVIVWNILTQPINALSDSNVYVPRGATLEQAIDSVAAQVSVPNRWLLHVSSRIVLKFSSKRLQSGWLVIHSDDSIWDIVKGLFSAHRKPSIRVVIPEGLTYREIASILKKTADIDSTVFVSWCESDSVKARFNIHSPTMEGYLMPNTYQFFFRESASYVGHRLATEFQRALAKLDSGLDSPFEIDSLLTLASIVQAEAASIDEMPRIAGVYTNRLKLGMKLEADPTVQYGLGWKRRVLYKHLNDDNEYNTYVRHGLPPGPINCMGTKAIQAAIKPEKHNYLFFVSKGDGSGTHRFSSTGAEHIKNVQRYRKNRR